MKKLILFFIVFLTSLSSFAISTPDTLLFVGGRKIPVLNYYIAKDLEEKIIYYQGVMDILIQNLLNF